MAMLVITRGFFRFDTADHPWMFLRILAVEKEIRQYSSGRVVNMPKLKERTTLLELEAILRGEPRFLGETHREGFGPFGAALMFKYSVINCWKYIEIYIYKY